MAAHLKFHSPSYYVYGSLHTACHGLHSILHIKDYTLDQTEFVKAIGTFLVIMNPFLSLPVFLAMTTGFSVSEQRKLATKITFFSAVMCVAILLAGTQIISFFGITIDQFRIAGGIVLAHIAWSMLSGKEITSHQGSTQEQDQLQALSGLAFYPMTFPLVVGPGTIATLIIYTSHTQQSEKLAVAGIVGAILLLLFGVLFFASEFGKVLSDTMRVITTRLMGMILLAISVGMVTSGIKAVFALH